MGFLFITLLNLSYLSYSWSIPSKCGRVGSRYWYCIYITAALAGSNMVMVTVATAVSGTRRVQPFGYHTVFQPHIYDILFLGVCKGPDDEGGRMSILNVC